LQADNYVKFDVIALLWPCYGLIALTFIFFAGSLLLFISTACNQFSSDGGGSESDTDHQQVFTCTVATTLLVNSGFFLAFSIVGFMTLLQEAKGDGIFD